MWSTESLDCGLMLAIKLRRSYLRSHWDLALLKPACSKSTLPVLITFPSQTSCCGVIHHDYKSAPVPVAYSSTISLWGAQARATAPFGQSVKFTAQQVIVADCFCFEGEKKIEIEILVEILFLFSLFDKKENVSFSFDVMLVWCPLQ